MAEVYQLHTQLGSPWGEGREGQKERQGPGEGKGTVAHGEIPGRKRRKELKWKTRIYMEKGSVREEGPLRGQEGIKHGGRCLKRKKWQWVEERARSWGQGQLRTEGRSGRGRNGSERRKGLGVEERDSWGQKEWLVKRKKWQWVEEELRVEERDIWEQKEGLVRRKKWRWVEEELRVEERDSGGQKEGLEEEEMAVNGGRAQSWGKGQMNTEGRASEEEEMAESGGRAHSWGKGQITTEGRTRSDEIRG
jgi:hypothetical protein